MVFNKDVSIDTKNNEFEFADAFNKQGAPAYEQFKAKKTIHAVTVGGNEVYIPYHAIRDAFLAVTGEEVIKRDDVCDEPLTCDDIRFVVVSSDGVSEVHDGDAIGWSDGLTNNNFVATTAADITSLDDIRARLVPIIGESSDSTQFSVENRTTPAPVVHIERNSDSDVTAEITLTADNGACSITFTLSGTSK